MVARARLLFFLDQNVPDSVGSILADAGHDVEYLRKHLAINAKDSVVAATAIERDAILISADGDFRGLARAAGVTRKQVHHLHRALIKCRDFEAAERFSGALDIIEHEWLRLSDGEVLHIEIGAKFIRTHR